MLLLIFFQIALVLHSMPREQCNAQIVGKLKRANGYLQMDIVLSLNLM